jgi:putative ABC transport system permease protein
MRKSDIVAREKTKWQKSTPAGYIFTMGVAVGFLIGVFICYQILYTDISDNLPQLATLKALGYHNRDLVRLVLTQAALLGMLGFFPAVVMTFGLYSTLTAITGIVTKLTIARVALVFILTLGMCFVAGLLAVRRAIAVDPAELF